ncbi:MAG TPA: zinc ribbon domain-containing protein [Terriglobia bacterium]|nr:zinc ribbon domain-containing protein [Terriglobia bacterium]
MPIFEYECRDCGTKFEKLISSQHAEIVCSQCASSHVEQRLSVFAVSGASTSEPEPGPCACGAPRRGMCGE